MRCIGRLMQNGPSSFLGLINILSRNRRKQDKPILEIMSQQMRVERKVVGKRT
jgi:hypothetical protein